MTASLTQAEARRMALAAQGFDSSHRTSAPDWPAIAKTLKQLHLLQIDSVNVLVRSHYLPLFSRLGPYDRALLDSHTLGNGERRLFECWAHEASLVPLDLHPLTRWRMDRARKGRGTYRSMNEFAACEARFLKATLAHVEKHGAIRASDVPGGGKSQGGWWGWSKGKMALETLFDQGRLTAAARNGFERVYDLPERVLPMDVLARETPPEREAFKLLIVYAAQALGVGTEFDLRDYFRLPVAETKIAIEDAVNEKLISPVAVEGWKAQAYVHPEARKPERIAACALVSPFDPIVWDRDRAERSFNFTYRIELYTPAHKRRYGYYVLPFLQGEAFAGRLCLKSDREGGALLVNAAHLEDGASAEQTAQALAQELTQMASWLGLTKVRIGRKGNLACKLRKAL